MGNVISPKVNAIAFVDFELAYYDLAVQNVIHNSIRTPLNKYIHIKRIYVNI